MNEQYRVTTLPNPNKGEQLAHPDVFKMRLANWVLYFSTMVQLPRKMRLTHL